MDRGVLTALPVQYIVRHTLREQWVRSAMSIMQRISNMTHLSHIMRHQDDYIDKTQLLNHLLLGSHVMHRYNYSALASTTRQLLNRPLRALLRGGRHLLQQAESMAHASPTADGPASFDIAALYEAMPVAHVLIDKAGIVMRCNRRAAALLQNADQALVGQKFLHLFSGAHLTALRRYLRQRARGASVGPMLLQMQTAHGTLRHVQIVARGVQGAQRGYLQVLLHDVDAAQTQATQDNFMVRTARILFDLADAQRVLDVAVALGSDELADEIFGFAYGQDGVMQNEACRGKLSTLQLQDAPPLRDVIEKICARRVTATRRAKIRAWQLEMADGAENRPWVGSENKRLLAAYDLTWLTVVPLVSRGRCLGALAFVGTCSTATRPRPNAAFLLQYAQQVAKALDNAAQHQQLQRDVHLRDSVLAIVAHDLSSPLNAIMLKSERAMRQALRSASDLVSLDAVKSIYTCGQRMQRLTQDLLDVSRVQRGELSMQMADVKVQELADQALDVIQEKMEAHSVSVVASLAVPEAQHVLCDRERILQVLGNLLDNAIKFSPKGGHITLTVTHQGDHQLLFQVDDTGDGFATDELEVMFSQFWQQQFKAHLGHGLGLYISRGIVRAHGGSIWAESSNERGGRVMFTLPCSRRS